MRESIDDWLQTPDDSRYRQYDNRQHEQGSASINRFRITGLSRKAGASRLRSCCTRSRTGVSQVLITLRSVANCEVRVPTHRMSDWPWGKLDVAAMTEWASCAISHWTAEARPYRSHTRRLT